MFFIEPNPLLHLELQTHYIKSDTNMTEFTGDWNTELHTSLLYENCDVLCGSTMRKIWQKSKMQGLGYVGKGSAHEFLEDVNDYIRDRLQTEAETLLNTEIDDSGLDGHVYRLGGLLLASELASEFDQEKDDHNSEREDWKGSREDFRYPSGCEIVSFYEGTLTQHGIDPKDHACIFTVWKMLKQYITKYGQPLIERSLDDYPSAWGSEALGFIGHGVCLDDEGSVTDEETGITIERVYGQIEIEGRDYNRVYACVEKLLSA